MLVLDGCGCCRHFPCALIYCLQVLLPTRKQGYLWVLKTCRLCGSCYWETAADSARYDIPDEKNQGLWGSSVWTGQMDFSSTRPHRPPKIEPLNQPNRQPKGGVAKKCTRKYRLRISKNKNTIETTKNTQQKHHWSNKSITKKMPTKTTHNSLQAHSTYHCRRCLLLGFFDRKTKQSLNICSRWVFQEI